MNILISTTIIFHPILTVNQRNLVSLINDDEASGSELVFGSRLVLVRSYLIHT